MKKGILILMVLFYSFLNCNVLFADTTPAQFALIEQTNVALNKTITSNTITVSNIDKAASISITGGAYAINGGAYTSADGTVSNNDTVTVQVISSASFNTTTEATLTIDEVSDTFSVTTVMFSFTDQTNVERNMTFTSNTITVTGLLLTTEKISITGGTYSLNNGSYTSADGQAKNGDKITVQLQSSANYFTKTDATLTIGAFSDTFSVTTQPDTPPDQFTFVDQTHVALNTAFTSNTITVSGIHAATTISITGGTYAINGGDYTDEEGTVNNKDTVTVKLTSSEEFDTTTEATLTIGGVSDTFSVRTIYVHESVDDGPCFIATAAFGSPLAGQVKILRQFRDRYLLTNTWGRKFVSWYYRNGPTAANFIKDKPMVKIAVQMSLYPLIGFSLLLISGYMPLAIILLLLSALIFLRLRSNRSITA